MGSLKRGKKKGVCSSRNSHLIAISFSGELGFVLRLLALAPAPAMDYNLAALKVFCCQLKEARRASSSTPPAMTIFGILFQRAWVQVT